jgi:hypothetical protein
MIRVVIAMLVQWLATGWTVRGSNPIGGEVFRIRLGRPWGPLALLYNWYLVFLMEVKQPDRDFDHPPQSNTEVKESVQLHLYFSSGLSSSVLEWGLSLLYVAVGALLYARTCICCIHAHTMMIFVPLYPSYIFFDPPTSRIYFLSYRPFGFHGSWLVLLQLSLL